MAPRAYADPDGFDGFDGFDEADPGAGPEAVKAGEDDRGQAN
ncbi:hypothetical protein [Streptomyces tauricus]